MKKRKKKTGMRPLQTQKKKKPKKKRKKNQRSLSQYIKRTSMERY